MFKIDIFPFSKRPFEKSQMRRRVLQSLSNHPDETAYFATAEDIILAKLLWFRMGGEVSDRQWNDILGVMRIQGDRIDQVYLQTWAKQLMLTDLLELAYQKI